MSVFVGQSCWILPYWPSQLIHNCRRVFARYQDVFIVYPIAIVLRSFLFLTKLRFNGFRCSHLFIEVHWNVTHMWHLRWSVVQLIACRQLFVNRLSKPMTSCWKYRYKNRDNSVSAYYVNTTHTRSLGRDGHDTQRNALFPIRIIRIIPDQRQQIDTYQYFFIYINFANPHLKLPKIRIRQVNIWNNQFNDKCVRYP